jgi:hypothetical protein
LAERLGRTVEELVFGSPAHKPLSADEFLGWAAHDKLTAWEREQAQKKANR